MTHGRQHFQALPSARSPTHKKDVEMTDLTNLSDDEITQNINELLNEQERRKRLALIPLQVADLAARYTADGGNISVIQQAVS